MDVYRMRADGSDPSHIFGLGISFKGMQLSPTDDAQLAFGEATLNSAIFIRNLINSQEITLVDGVESFGAYPAWSPDGSKIAFVRDGPTISTVDLDGTNLVDLRTFDGLRGIRDLDWLGLPSIVPTR
jgi:Tol biopolymer transport system component